MRASHWILFLSSIFLLCTIAIGISKFASPQSAQAEIYQEGILMQTIDLSSVTEPEKITLTSKLGENIILIEHGQISMYSSTCPDQLCVHQGIIKNGIYPIVCLPNQVVIQIKSSNTASPDAVSR
ncbi:NusG domain II-containing protein [Ructibacterium gallinarum]|uniref:NusG domain II-containing protein n=1 Tax=Ructibacterium gallinarum TaxID=2779355 RepID=A0A9D5R8L5_9FIRM|nr:NusG domain II-containing protein [Ructibacterium gallinarum]MBE5040092.1 NusG domain II-containing protein [Ructibacterium gallinarum]